MLLAMYINPLHFYIDQIDNQHRTEHDEELYHTNQIYIQDTQPNHHDAVCRILLDTFHKNHDCHHCLYTIQLYMRYIPYFHFLIDIDLNCI